MPAPTNISAATATNVSGLLPYTINQNVHDAGTTYTVWYTYTPDYTGVLGVWGFGALSGYTPQTSVFDNGGVDIYGGISGYPQRPIQVPVVSGQQIWFRFLTTNSTVSPAVLSGLIQPFTPTVTPAGSLFINDASSATYLATLLSGTTGAPLNYVLDFPGGEHMAQLANGVILVEDLDELNLKVYSAVPSPIATVAISQVVSLSSNRLDLFYVGHSAASSTPGLVQTVTAAGVIGATTWDVGPGMSSLAPARDNSILYYAEGTAAAPIKRWDLVGNAGLSDLAAGVADHTIRELFVLADGTVLAIYRDTSPVSSFFVRQFSAAGAILVTYTAQFTDSTGSDPHLAIALDDPASFWVWFKVAGAKSRFVNITTASGTIVSTGEWVHFSSGLSDETTTATPSVYFGHSESCTFVVTTEQPTPNYTTDVLIPRRLRRATHLSTEQLWNFYHAFQLDLETGVGLTTGQGSDPQIMLRYSDDGGHTWSSELWVSAGALGNYAHRAIWRRLGRSRDRIFEIVYSEPTKLALVNAYLDVSGGTS
jgi:hypothetical protein